MLLPLSFHLYWWEYSRSGAFSPPSPKTQSATYSAGLEAGRLAETVDSVGFLP
jgi:hypothetical protein